MSCLLRRRQRGRQPRGAPGQQRDSLVDVAPGGGGADAEPAATSANISPLRR